MHEMMTNAVKYGALSVSEGKLALTWALADNGDCVLEWLESSGPPVATPTHEGFGSKLVRSTIGYDLGGAVAVEYRPGGVWARFVIPAAHLMEPSETAPARPATPVHAAFFAGKDILVLEDQALIAMDTEETLRRLGAFEVRCYANGRDAKTGLKTLTPDCAILDFNLGDHTSADVADDLLARGIPFAFATGYGDSVMIPDRFLTIPILHKPLNSGMILEAFASTGTEAPLQATAPIAWPLPFSPATLQEPRRT